MAYDSASFEKMLEQIQIIHANIFTTFGSHSDFSVMYNTPFYWNQNYENSIQANLDYLDGLEARLNQTIIEKNLILAGNKTILIPYAQYYQQTLDGFRNESKREGGLDWAIGPSWFMTFASSDYYLWWWLLPIEIVLWIVIALLFVSGNDW